MPRIPTFNDTLGATGVSGIEFYNDLIGQTGNCGSNTYAGGYPDLTVISNVKGLHDGNVEFAVESVTHLLCHVAQVDVIVGYFTVVYGCAEILVCSVGSTVL